MLVRSKFFPQFVEKIEKLKICLSKQHNKMLKMRSEMLNTRKKGKTIKVENVRDIEIPGNFFENSSTKEFFWKLFNLRPLSFSSYSSSVTVPSKVRNLREMRNFGQNLSIFAHCYNDFKINWF